MSWKRLKFAIRERVNSLILNSDCLKVCNYSDENLVINLFSPIFCCWQRKKFWIKLLWYIPLNCNCEHVHREWMILMTRPWVEARKESGPVQTNNVTIWNRNGKWLATEIQKEIQNFIIISNNFRFEHSWRKKVFENIVRICVKLFFILG